ncbi:putative thiol oxidoreductase [Labilithrix luteola]|uniref:Putative thiol oxidoreductase n=1 Tax=Labilithrix luteola TaxID=1391654 RepID=A0A0K1QE41_9BACT|nr:di-heme oxidoredictase family protein [Labilithrix luteola]AKV03695.1 putative thiol oxidoreductase [Labilithrix luteola]
MNARFLCSSVLCAALFAACSEDAVQTPPSPSLDVDAASPGENDSGATDAGYDGPSDASPADASSDSGIAVLEEGELEPGGATTTSNVDIGAFNMAAANLALARRGGFEAGLQFFQLPWVVAPGRPEADGLGPTFNSDSCLGCHVRNGRGNVASVLLRIGLGPNSDALPNYGKQFQPFGISGVPGEGTPVRAETAVTHAKADGTSVSLTAVSYSIANPAFGPLGEDLRISPRIAPQIVGQGLLEAIPEADLLALADPDDQNGDGISGRAHWVQDGETQRIGRFGWKALQPTVEAQTAGAFSEDLGITSSRFPETNCPGTQTACAAAQNGGSPELGATRLAVTVEYMRLLGVPKRRGGDSEDVLKGKALFSLVGCTSCHKPSFVTRPDASEPELSSQRIWPYSDLLLHDMGERLADNKKEGDAGEREWRTPPLWSLGLVKTVNGTLHLLHDGRAPSIDEAILWHDGEAQGARNAYERLSAADQALLHAFVESL